MVCVCVCVSREGRRVKVGIQSCLTILDTFKIFLSSVFLLFYLSVCMRLFVSVCECNIQFASVLFKEVTFLWEWGRHVRFGIFWRIFFLWGNVVFLSQIIGVKVFYAGGVG